MVNQPARRDSASLPGVRGFYQPSQRDSDSRRGPRGSTSRLGGTRPPGAGQHGCISRAGGTQPPCTVSVGPTSQPDGLSLRARCSTSLPGGLSLLARDAGVDHPARWYSSSVCGPRGRPSCPAGLSLLAQAAGVYQPARRDSASVHGVRGFNQPARQTQPAGAVHGGRAAGQAETASGSWPARLSQLGGTQPAGAVHGGRPAGQAGLGLRARGNTSLPGRTQPRGTCRRYRAARRAESASGRWAAWLD